MAMQRWQWSKSPVTRVLFRGQRVHVKRDDVFHLAGNKMRKMYWFVKQDDAFYRDAHLFSYGGSQSNAMFALAQLAHAKQVPFTYFSRALRLRGEPANRIQGNLAAAKALGMRHVELATDAYHVLVQTRAFAELLDSQLRPPPGTRSLYVPQGAAFPEAQDGVALLAQEINEYVATEWPDKHFSVVLPCGTGTTALYLAQHLHPAIHLYAVPCVGDAAYLRQQFQQLIEDDPSLQQQQQPVKLPQVLTPRRKCRFGRLWWPLYDMHHELLEETKLEFDLVYGAFAWHTLFSDVAVLDEVLGRVDSQSASSDDACSLLLGTEGEDAGWNGERELLYVHTGGTSGNATMLARYEQKKRRYQQPAAI